LTGPTGAPVASTLIDRRFREKIILVGVAIGRAGTQAVEDSLKELALLVDTAGADVVGQVVQRRPAADPATFLGRGKAEELAALSRELDADTVVFDEELNPAQQRNLEKILGRTAIDRTAVILDIFAQNARTEEGKAQVEMALLRYRMPRLRGRGASFSQQGGGIGTRGPGETRLEEDRRRLQVRLAQLELELKRLSRVRQTQRRARRRHGVPAISLVGYTNAGKSSLLNALTAADVLVEDRLFATLDPRTRRLDLPGGQAVVVSDTVGFVNKLPHQLVQAFKATLEVVEESDLLVHVVDSPSVDPEGQIEAVRTVLTEIGANSVPELLAFNKADLGPAARELSAAYPGSVVISALTGFGRDDLLAAIGDRLRSSTEVYDLMVPYSKGHVLASLRRQGEVITESYNPSGTRVRARLRRQEIGNFQEYRTVEGA
jgi:GTP-binding protein HflX